jgi:thioredoxin 1
MAEENPEVVFLKVDVDECEDLASDYNISCMPTFLFLKNGAKVAEFSGANESQLKGLVTQHK